MHTIQVLAIELDGIADVQDAVYAALPEHGTSWSDWSEVGGRWSGYLGAFAEEAGVTLPDPSGNTLRIADHEQIALTVLDRAARQQNRTFLQMRDAIAGNAVTAADVDGYMFGLPVADTEETAQRITESNRADAARWTEMLRQPSLEAARSMDLLMVTYRTRKMLNLLHGYWDADSGFYWPEQGDAQPQTLITAITNGAYPKDLHLVAVDFHY